MFVVAGAVGVVATLVGPSRPTAAATSPIQHVVVVFQENHSFDNVLGRLCSQIDLGIVTHDPCDGATTGVLPNGDVIPLADSPDIVPGVIHDVASQQIAIDGGKMDGFGLIKGCTVEKAYACYSQFEPEQIPNLAALSEAFVISDRTFEFATTPSWGGHMVLASATLDGFLGDNPNLRTTSAFGWGCDSKNDGLWWNGSAYVLEPTCVPDRSGHGPYRSSPVRFVPTIFDRLDAAQLTWKIYGGTGVPGAPGSGYSWTICPMFYECLGSPQRNNLVPAAQVISDATAGSLPNYAVVTPLTADSQHNRYSMMLGDDWIGRVVGSIMDGPDWASTAIFIVYDDCGCFYDHVPPPNATTGIREPMTIVSPFAKAGFTDSTDATFMSMLAFVEHTFGLLPLTGADATAYDYRDSFDFAQRPLPPIPLTQTGVPLSELRFIASHPPRGDDPT
jgi:phospholipase C